MQHAHHSTGDPRNPRSAIALAAGVALVLLVGCTMVGDKLTGVRLHKGNPTTCLKQCNDLYKLIFDEEQKLHDANIEHCQTLDQTEKNACLQEESARHSEEKADLAQDKNNCQDNCHDQGGGRSG